jgi:hypothetical protein
VLDYGLLPRPTQQRAFVAAYLSALLGGLGLGPPPPGGGWCEEGGGGGGVDGVAGAAVPDGAGGGAGSKGSGSPRSVWAWLERHGVARPPAGGGGGAATPRLPEAAWRSLFLETLASARAYVRVSHLVWALWGLILAKDCSVEFDYLDYSAQRWAEFRKAVPPPPGARAGSGGGGARAGAGAAAVPAGP